MGKCEITPWPDTYIHILILRKYLIEVVQEFHNLGARLQKSFREIKTDPSLLRTSVNSCTNLSVLVYDSPVPAGWSTALISASASHYRNVGLTKDHRCVLLPSSMYSL
jgi:hypothetical protein